MADPRRRALPSILFPAALLALAASVGACSSSESARSCVAAGEGEICAWRDGGVRLDTEGLQPGSPFSYAVTGDGSASIASPADLAVGDDGRVPGAMTVLSATGGRVTIDVNAVAADGSPVTGRLVVE